MKTTENNRLIALFMGSEEDHNGEFDLFGTSSLGNVFQDVEADNSDAKHFFSPEEMKFHNNWDWLMPVVEKIETIFNGDIPIVSISQESCEIEFYDYQRDDQPTYFAHGGKLKSTLDCVVSFIEWYNQQSV